MSLYDNETKIYPDLNPTAPKSKSYRLNKLSEIETYFFSEIYVREQISKNKRRFSTITGIVDIVITAGIAIAASVCQWCCIALYRNSLLLSLATAITRKSFKIFTVKQEKHDAIKLLAQSKLDSIANIISQGNARWRYLSQ